METKMTIDERLSRLERGQRMWRTLAVGSVVLPLIVIAMVARDQLGGRRLRVSALEIVDPSGKVVASLAAESSGPVLRMLSPEANAHLAIGAFSDQLGFVLFDDENPRALLALGENGFPALSFRDHEGRGRLIAGLSSDPDASPFLHLSDEGGRVRLLARVAENPVMLLRDEGGTALFSAP